MNFKIVTLSNNKKKNQKQNIKSVDFHTAPHFKALFMFGNKTD